MVRALGIVRPVVRALDIVLCPGPYCEGPGHSHRAPKGPLWALGEGAVSYERGSPVLKNSSVKFFPGFRHAGAIVQWGERCVRGIPPPPPLAGIWALRAGHTSIGGVVVLFFCFFRFYSRA